MFSMMRTEPGETRPLLTSSRKRASPAAPQVVAVEPGLALVGQDERVVELPFLLLGQLFGEFVLAAYSVLALSGLLGVGHAAVTVRPPWHG